MRDPLLKGYFMQRSTVKNISRAVLSLGASKIVSQVVRNNVAVSPFPMQIVVIATTFVAGNMLGNSLSNYVDETVDQIADAAKAAKENTPLKAV